MRREPEPGTLARAPSRPAPRPAAVLAAAVAAGTWTGHLLAGEPLLPGGLLLAAAPLAFLARAPGRTTALGWLLVLLACGLRAYEAASPRTEPPPRARFPAAALPPEERVQVGRWRPLDRSGSVGRLEGDDRGVVLVLDGAPPARGDLLAILPGDPLAPLPRGPVPGPRAADGDRGRRRVRADAWLHVDGMPARAEGASDSDAPAVESSPLSGLAHAWRGSLEGLRSRVRARLQTLERHGAPVGLARALVLGESEAVPRRFEDLTRRTGVRHLLAVSGMHVGVVGFLLIAPLVRRCGRAAGLVALLAFVLLAGAGSPVVRAGLAAALALLAPGCGRTARPSLGTRPTDRDRSLPGLRPVAFAARRVDAATLWCLALTVELGLAPTGLRALGVQLSYLATAGILLGLRPLTAAIRARLEQATPLRLRGPVLTERLARLLFRRALDRGASVLAVSCAATLGTAPVAWAHFGELAPVGLVLTPLALLPVGAALLVGLAAPLLPVELAGSLLGLAAVGLEHLLGLADRLPGTPWVLPARPPWILAALGLVGFAWLRAANRATGRSTLREGSRDGGRARGTLLLATGGVLLPWSPAAAAFELHVLDSGHGTCAIARAPGLEALVYDAGSRDRSALYSEAIAPLFARWDVARPVVVLSHDHRDHQSALEELVSRYPPRLWAGTASASVPLARRIPRAGLTRGRMDLPLRRDAAVRARLLRGLPEGGNEGSVALELELRGDGVDPPARVLLLGDAEAEGLDASLRAGLLPRDVELLLAPHHGSDTPLLGALLEWTRPRAVWVPSNGRPPIADELERRGIAWSTPAEAGPLSLRIPPGPTPAVAAPSLRSRAHPAAAADPGHPTTPAERPGLPPPPVELPAPGRPPGARRDPHRRPRPAAAAPRTAAGEPPVQAPSETPRGDR